MLEMTDHEFVEGDFRRHRARFSDGTTVTVDLDTEEFTILPALEIKSD
jgi:hypothetical protein